MKIVQYITGLCFIAILSACGGGDAPSLSPERVVQSLRSQAATISISGMPTTDAATQLMDFAEINFPTYFPGHQTNSTTPDFIYRYYPTEQIYLGIALSTGPYIQGNVYVVGPPFGNTLANPLDVGPITKYITVATSNFGKLTTKIGINGSGARSVAIQSDGKIVVSGVSITATRDSDFALVRYNVNGSLDTSFGTSGFVTTNIFGRVASTDWARGSVIQSDGKIVVAGYTQRSGDSTMRLVVLRYNSDGSMDSTFAGSGIVQSQNSTKHKTGHAVVLQPDGKILIAGAVSCNDRFTPGYCTLLERYNSDGSLDSSFSGPGVNRVDGSTQGAQGLALQRDGKVLVVGTKNSGNGDELSVARYNENGHTDSTFGIAGVATIPIGLDVGSHNSGSSIALHTDGSIFVSGVAHSDSSNNHFSVTKLHPDGVVDTSFGRLGSVVTNVSVPPESDYSYGIAVQPDGKILVAGESSVIRTNQFPFPGFYSAVNVNFALVRYTAAGVLDTTFAGTGMLSIDFNTLDDRCYGIALQPNGSVVLVGAAYTYDPANSYGGYSSFGVVRIKSDGTYDTIFSSAN